MGGWTVGREGKGREEPGGKCVWEETIPSLRYRGEGAGVLAGAAELTSKGEDGGEKISLSHPVPFCPPF